MAKRSGLTFYNTGDEEKNTVLKDWHLEGVVLNHGLDQDEGVQLGDGVDRVVDL